MTNEDEERRVNSQRDHDLLVSHTVKLDQLFTAIQATNTTMEKFIEKVDLRCDARAKAIDRKCDTVVDDVSSKVSGQLFRWLIGIMVTCIIMLTGAVGYNEVVSSNNRIIILQNIEDIDSINKTIDNLHERE